MTTALEVPQGLTPEASQGRHGLGKVIQLFPHREGGVSILKGFASDPETEEKIPQIVPTAPETYAPPEEGTVHTLAGSVEVPGVEEPVDYRLFIGAALTDPRLRLFANGFGGILASSEPYGEWVGAHGGVMLAVEPARKNKSRSRALTDPHAMHADVYEAAIEHATTSKEFQDLPNNGLVDTGNLLVDMHSMGEKSGGRFIRRHRNSVRQATHIQTVGLEGRVGIGFVGRVLPALLGDIGPAILKGDLDHLGHKLEVGATALRYFATNGWQTVGEAVSCMLADELEHVIELKESGIKQVGIFSDEDDLIHGVPSLVRTAKHMDHSELWLGVGHLAPQTLARLLASRTMEATAQVTPVPLKASAGSRR